MNAKDTQPTMQKLLAERTMPSIRRPPVPGRNDRCPCGSGRKFKKCHAARKAA